MEKMIKYQPLFEDEKYIYPRHYFRKAFKDRQVIYVSEHELGLIRQWPKAREWLEFLNVEIPEEVRFVFVYRNFDEVHLIGEHKETLAVLTEKEIHYPDFMDYLMYTQYGSNWGKI